MAKKKASYDVTPEKVVRSGKVIANAVDGKLVMEEGCENYRMIANKMWNVKMKETSSAPIEKDTKKEEVIEEQPLVIEKDTTSANEPQEAVQINAPVNTQQSTEQLLVKALAKINDLEEKLTVVVPPELAVEPRRRKKDVHNPFGWDEKEGVPQCPNGGEAGTKHPDVIAWAEEHYPEEAADAYDRFYASQHSRKLKAQRKQTEKAQYEKFK